MKIILMTFIILLLSINNLIGQKNYTMNFKQNDSLSYENGVLKISPDYFFPDVFDTTWQQGYFIKLDDEKYKEIKSKYFEKAKKEFGSENIIDTFYYIVLNETPPKYCSEYLDIFEEPILYNYFLNKTIIRFTWVRAFHAPIIIKLEKEFEKVTLIIKKYNNSDDDESKFIEIKQELNINKYNEIDSLINHTKIKCKKPSIPDGGEDGSEWIIEFHDKEGYYYCNRWSPKNTDVVRLIGIKLIDLSGLNEKIY